MDSDNIPPIDIHCPKLLDWLISRRHCNKKWQQEVVEIREKINLAIQGMPEREEVVQLLSGTYINYFHCKRILEILAETEADTKNLFGFYSSQRMKDWQQIVKLYEKENIFLAESAQILQRLVQYDIPAMKKQLSKCSSTLTECDKKEADFMRQSRESAKNFERDCKKMGIKGEKIRTELLHLAENLPEFFANIAKDAKTLKEACDYYAKFRQHLLQGNSSEKSLLPMLNFVMEKGDVTCFEWKFGKAPERIEPVFEMVNDENDKDRINLEIDFGEQILEDNDPNIVEVVDQIDFGLEVVEDSSEVDAQAQRHRQISTSDPNANIARGSDAASVLENSETQKAFITDLLELSLFLKSRLEEIADQHPSDYILANQRSKIGADNPLLIWGRSDGRSDWIQEAIDKIAEIERTLTEKDKKHLFKIRTDKKYLESLATEIELKQDLPRRYSALADLQQEKRREAVDENKNLSPELELMLNRGKELKENIESEISKKYDGRTVNVLTSGAL